MEAKALTYQQEAPRRDESKHTWATHVEGIFFIIVNFNYSTLHSARLVNEHKFATLAENWYKFIWRRASVPLTLYHLPLLYHFHVREGTVAMSFYFLLVVCKAKIKIDSNGNRLQLYKILFRGCKKEWSLACVVKFVEVYNKFWIWRSLTTLFYMVNLYKKRQATSGGK